MSLVVIEKNELQKLLAEAVEKAIARKIPEIKRQLIPKYISTTELMKITHWSRRKIQYLRDNREIPFIQNGKKILYKLKDIEDFINKHTVKPNSI